MILNIYKICLKFLKTVCNSFELFLLADKNEKEVYLRHAVCSIPLQILIHSDRSYTSGI